MNINELFEKIQDEIQTEELEGELVLHGNCIVWTYKLDDCEELEGFYDLDEDEICFDFESICIEELLQEAYEKDNEKLTAFIDQLEEMDNWTFSDPETIDEIISFKIF